MLTLPDKIIAVLAPLRHYFRAVFFLRRKCYSSARSLRPRRRTVASALRVMGLAHTPHFQNYHRVLNRAHLVATKGRQNAAASSACRLCA